MPSGTRATAPPARTLHQRDDVVGGSSPAPWYSGARFSRRGVGGCPASTVRSSSQYRLNTGVGPSFADLWCAHANCAGHPQPRPGWPPGSAVVAVRRVPTPAGVQAVWVKPGTTPPRLAFTASPGAAGPPDRSCPRGFGCRRTPSSPSPRGVVARRVTFDVLQGDLVVGGGRRGGCRDDSPATRDGVAAMIAQACWCTTPTR